jgi:hypothetical protein
VVKGAITSIRCHGSECVEFHLHSFSAVVCIQRPLRFCQAINCGVRWNWQYDHESRIVYFWKGKQHQQTFSSMYLPWDSHYVGACKYINIAITLYTSWNWARTAVSLVSPGSQQILWSQELTKMKAYRETGEVKLHANAMIWSILRPHILHIMMSSAELSTKFVTSRMNKSHLETSGEFQIPTLHSHLFMPILVV